MKYDVEWEVEVKRYSLAGTYIDEQVNYLLLQIKKVNYTLKLLLISDGSDEGKDVIGVDYHYYS